ncbi:MAG TPA: twin-arginine translocase TatA/TatE family subunit [Nitrososphaeraceae archaeon]|nr:twin-arginine translocase TatA/TatE family subunit [Nitrososphaeraceae archaeon]
MAFENVLLVVILIGVVLFGAKKLPELARALGKAQSEFEKGKRESIRETSTEENRSVSKQAELTSEPRTDNDIRK